MSLYLSKSSIIPNISASLLLTKPYTEGGNNFQRAFASSNESLTSRAAYFGVGLSLTVPLINMVSLLILREQAKKECRFTVEDIRLLASLNLGMRHVSSRDAAEQEKSEGLKGGCSLALVPTKCKLTHLQGKNWTNIQPDEQNRFLECFEEGVNDFIHKSLNYDITRVTGPIELGHTKLKNTAELVNFFSLLIINYEKRGSVTEVEMDTWGQGLGRFPANHIEGKNITIIPYVNVEDLGYSESELQQSIRTVKQGDELYRRMIDCYRINLLQTIRSMQSQAA